MLKGKQVIIRAVHRADMEELILWLNDVEGSGEFLPYGMVSEPGFRGEFEKSGFLTDSSLRLLVTSLDGEILGMVWAFRAIPYMDALEVGYRIFDAAQRGKGYATEALRLLIDYLFLAKPLSRLELRAASENAASLRVAEKAGFVREGLLRDAAFSKGRRHDLYTFSLLRSEWQRYS